MSELWVHTPGVGEFSLANERIAAEITAAGTMVGGAGPEVLGPVFGLIGADFLTVFAQAHAAHFGAIHRLAAVHQSMSGAAGAAAASYSSTDTAHAALLGAVSA